MHLFRRKERNSKYEPSLRRRCFALFREGHRPAAVIKMVPVRPKTCYRYYESCKKLKHQVPYLTVRRWLRDNPEFNEKVIRLLSTSLDMPPEEVVIRLQKPWGLLRAMKGEWPNYRLERQRTEMEQRLLAALAVVKFAEVFGKRDLRLMKQILERLMNDDHAIT
jgi:hypothetical protein